MERLEVAGGNGYTLRLDVDGDGVPKFTFLRTATMHHAGIVKALSAADAVRVAEWIAKATASHVVRDGATGREY